MENPDLRKRVNEIFKLMRQDSSRFLKELKKLLKEAEKSEDIYVVGRINLQLAICYFDLGYRDKILHHAVKAVDIFESMNDHPMLGRSYNVLGLAYRAQGNYLRAIEFYNRALEMVRGMKKPSIRRDVMMNNIAECYYLMGEHEKSIKLLKECLSSVHRRKPDDHVHAVIYTINLSDAYEGLEEYKKSLEALDAVATNVELLARDVLLWGYYARRCCVLYKNNDLAEGERYADLTIEAVNTGYDSYEFHRDFEKIAMLEIQSGDYRRAQCFADILTKYANDNGHTIDLIVSKRVQAKICDSSGEHDRALSLYRDLNSLYEKRMREQNEMQYESQKNAEAASREIGKLMKKIRISEEKAERDPLTGLMNRSALVSVTNSFIQTAKEKGKKLGGVFLDIDFFKEYNDTYGHAAGDEAIKYIARVCMEEETASVKFFRYGGDEYFGIVLGLDDRSMERLALRISEKVHNSGLAHVKNPNGQRLTVSIGVVNVDMKESDRTVLDVIQFADKALYHAKDAGKDRAFSIDIMPNDEHTYQLICAR